jgi:hypothetical protein
MPEEGEGRFFMLAHVYVRRKKDEESGYTNTSFRLQGVGLNGTVPVRVCYFGKPVMEPVMERLLDVNTQKPKVDKNGKEIWVEKKDEEGNVALQEKKDKDGKVIQRDEHFSERVDVLSMFSGNMDDGTMVEPVEIIAKQRSVQSGNGDKYIYFAVCGNEEIPIEVPDFSTADRPDYNYKSNCRKLAAMAKRV